MVSVVIPVYNVEQYLGECLDSVLGQSHRDIEVIVVNDGSTDHSGNIAKCYADRDERIKYYKKTNGGLSDARNYGMQFATGEYVFFLDSDDYISHDAIANLLDFGRSHRCDVVQGGFYYLFDDHLEYDNRWLNDSSEFVMDKEYCISALIDNCVLKNFAWGKLYRRELIDDLMFPKGRYFEDSYWQYLVAHKANGYGVLTAPLYYYRQRPTSISGSASDRVLDLLRGYEGRMVFIDEHYPKFKDKAVSSYFHHLLDICYNSESEAKREYWNYAMAAYAEDFRRCLKSDIFYQLSQKNHRRTLNTLKLVRRVYDQFFAKRLKYISK